MIKPSHGPGLVEQLESYKNFHPGQEEKSAMEDVLSFAGAGSSL